MRVDIRAHLDFLNILGLLLLARFCGFFLGLVLVLPEVQNLADWRIVVWRYFNQIEALLSGNLPGFVCVYNTVVFTFGIDELNFRDRDLVI